MEKNLKLQLRNKSTFFLLNLLLQPIVEFLMFVHRTRKKYRADFFLLITNRKFLTPCRWLGGSVTSQVMNLIQTTLISFTYLSVIYRCETLNTLDDQFHRFIIFTINVQFYPERRRNVKLSAPASTSIFLSARSVLILNFLMYWHDG